MFAVNLLNASYGNDPVPSNYRIYTLVSLIGCDELKVPFYLLLCIIYGFRKTKSKNPIILLDGMDHNYPQD